MAVYDHLYISPHLDDAVLSCGGTIASQVAAGETVLVVTLFAGDAPPGPRSDFALLLHERWGLGDNPFVGRRAEDQRSLNALGAAAIQLSFPDAIYRTGPDGALLYPSREGIFGPVHPSEDALVDELARSLAALGVPETARVYVPLGVGGHVDHVLTRRAAERWHPARAGFWYFEEYPYAEAPEHIAVALGADAWRAQLIFLTTADLEAKIEAIGYHASQIDSLFADLDDMRRRVYAYAALVARGQGYAEQFYLVDLPADK
jgi:LmbE family N-acetylglucosaminyl deacetylase